MRGGWGGRGEGGWYTPVSNRSSCKTIKPNERPFKGKIHIEGREPWGLFMTASFMKFSQVATVQTVFAKLLLSEIPRLADNENAILAYKWNLESF